jgi:hypothetical protein
MTAYIATQAAIATLDDDLAAQFTVRMSDGGSEPETHIGMNWRGVPRDVHDALAATDGVTHGDDFWALAESMGLQSVEPEK